MEIEDFYEIGMGFIGTSTNEDSILPSNEMSSINNVTSNKAKEYTSDGRNKDKFSIIMKPDPNIPNPDSTGNGVAISVEAYKDDPVATSGVNLKDYYKCVDDAAKAKSQYNNLRDHVYHTKSILDDLITKTSNIIKLNNETQIYNILFNNISRANRKTDIEYSFAFLLEKENYKKLSLLFKTFVDCLKIFNPVDNSNYKKIELSLTSEIWKIINVNNFKQSDSCYNFNDILGTNFENINNLLIELRKCFDTIVKIDPNEIFNSKLIKLKNHIKEYDESSASILKDMVDLIYDRSLHMETFFELFSINFTKYLNLFSPDKKTSIFIDNKKIIYNIEKLNPWVSTDYHLLKELMHQDNFDNIERTEKIIEMHNSIVKPNDLFLFLGDISEEEFFKNGKAINPKIEQKLIECIKRLNGRKIILLGNNDTASTSFYYKAGFIEVYEDPIITRKYIFSHGPIATTTELINVHGHIHGNKKYWDVDWHNHVDAFYALWGKPVKLNYLTNPKTLGFYYNGCISEKGKWVDPEVRKQPMNIIK